jgi:tetratricopeptide (TPR) repeat protein
MKPIASIFERRRRISDAIANGIVDRELINLLLEDGQFKDEESPYWDYKVELPEPPKCQSDLVRAEYAEKSAEIVKDCVSFYNSFGGYILSGVADAGKEIVGASNDFDATDINKKIKSATGHNIETIYKEIDVSDLKQGAKLGLLFIPQRPPSQNPAQFKKDAPSGRSKPAYKARTFYMRERDTCRCAESPEDFEFLYGPRQAGSTVAVLAQIESNLPPREPDFDGLIGREEELMALWNWLSDSFSPIKIICGLGGLGKTSLVYTFAERLLKSYATDFDRMIWLSAKDRTFSAERNQEVPTQRLDFTNIEELLRQILLESGCPEEQMPEDADRDTLLQMSKDHLSHFSYIIIVDNVDTLSDDDQQLIFHLFTQLCSSATARCILTARRNLGAPVSAYLELQGLSRSEFQQFVDEKGRAQGLQLDVKNRSVLDPFYAASGGSPLFAQSILRFVALGDSLGDAIANWKGADGEEVRNAAFAREIGRLKRNQARALLALCYLEYASVIELGSVLGLNRFEVQEAIETLRSFGMTNIKTNLPGGAAFQPSPAIALVVELIEKRVGDFSAIRQACKQLRRSKENKKPHIGHAVSRAIALIDLNDASGALEVVNKALKELPDDPDLLCLLARCLKAAGQRTRAIDTYRRAHSLGCRKRELFQGWAGALKELEDWNGLIELSKLAETAIRSSEYSLIRARAHAEIGHEKVKAGNYAASMAAYEAGLSELRESLGRYTSRADRGDLWRENDELVLAWLGAASLRETSELGDGYRLFSAHFRAVSYWSTRRKAAFEGALSALSFWLERVSSRPRISEKTIENLTTASTRLDKVSALINDRAMLNEDDRSRLQTRCTRLSEQLLDLMNRDP